MKKHLAYSESDDGKWYKLEYSIEQCEEKVFGCGLGQRCQGKKGHKGVHWFYALDGSYEWHDNDNDPIKGQEGYSGTIPPDHPTYVHPKDMADKHYRHHDSQWEEITDQELILKLKNDEVHGVGITIDRPVPPEEWAKIEKKLKKKKK